MDIYLRTRGQPRELDYRFLGEAPEDFWWRSYLQVTDIERPTILVRSDGTSWQAYIAGIRSRRRDATDTPIGFNLVLAGDCGPAHADDNALALEIIGRSAADLAAQNGLFMPGDLLDERLPANDVDRMLAAPEEETVTVAADAVRAAYGPLVAGDAPPAQGEAPLPDGSWIGGLANRKAQAAFAALTARLLVGERTGRAIAVNLVTQEADLDELPEWKADLLGVLSALPGPHLGMPVQSLGKGEPPPETGVGPAENGRQGRHSRPGWSLRRPRRKTVLIVAGMVVGAVAIAVILIEVLRQPPTH